MNEDFYKERAIRVRDIAETADPFTKKRLLDLADEYDVRARKPLRASGTTGRPASLSRAEEGKV